MTDFKIKTEYLKEFLNCCDVVSGEAVVTIKNNEWHATLTDPANVCALDAILPDVCFESWTSPENELNIGIDLFKFISILKTSDKGSAVSIDILPSNEQQLMELTFDNNLKYNVQLPNAKYMDKAKVPDVAPRTEVILNSSEVIRGCNAASKISPYVYFGVDKEKEQFYIEALSDSKEKANYSIDREDLVGLTADESVRSLFSLVYIQSMLKVLKKKELTLGLGNNYVLRMHSYIANDLGEIWYYLAPRIEEEDYQKV